MSPKESGTQKSAAASFSVSQVEDSAEEMPIEVRRSVRRIRTVSAYLDEGRMVLLIPARFSKAQEQEWAERMRARLMRRKKARTSSDAQLLQSAHKLSASYLGGIAQPSSVAWVTNQNRRWGSCTPSDRSIRLSNRLQGMPRFVIDYVLLHELAHLIESGHGPEFWALLAPYPETERAKAYLDGYSMAMSRARDADQDSDQDPDQDSDPDQSSDG